MMDNKWNQGILYIEKDGRAVCRGEETSPEVVDTCEAVADGITRHTLTYRNCGEAREIIPVFEVVTEGIPDFYMIPCVNYNRRYPETGAAKDLEYSGHLAGTAIRKRPHKRAHQ